MNPEQFDREVERLEAAYENGLIDAVELREEMRLIRQAYREAAAESAQDAYNREMERW